MKETWATIKDALNKTKNKNTFPDHFKIGGREINDKLALSNRFNLFFTNIVGPKFASEISSDSNCSYKSFLKNKTSEVFTFSKVDKPTVVKIINDFPAKSSRGFDGISIKLLKSIKYEILDPLTIVIDQSLHQGIFPNKLKLAKVIPLHKKGDPTCIDNYRPISILPSISGGGPRVVVSTAAFHARVRSSVPGLGGLKETKNVSSPFTCESQYCGEPP